MRLSVDSQALGLSDRAPTTIKSGRADVVRETEGNTIADEEARKQASPRSPRAKHDVQSVESNSGDPRRTPQREYGRQCKKQREPKRGAGVG